MEYNHISKDIEKKHKQKLECIYRFINSQNSTINEFVKEYDDSFGNTFLDFRNFILENYKRVFESNSYFLQVLIERGVKRSAKNKIEKRPYFYHNISNTKLKVSFVKAVKKWLMFEETESNISNQLYYFAQQNMKGENKEIKKFLAKWNMNRHHYYNARTGFLKNGLVIEKKEKKKNSFDLNYRFQKPVNRLKNKLENEKILIKRRKSKTVLKEFAQNYFEGRIKGVETIQAMMTLNIPLNASITEIKEKIQSIK